MTITLWIDGCGWFRFHGYWTMATAKGIVEPVIYWGA